MTTHAETKSRTAKSSPTDSPFQIRRLVKLVPPTFEVVEQTAEEMRAEINTLRAAVSGANRTLSALRTSLGAMVELLDPQDEVGATTHLSLALVDRALAQLSNT